MLLREVKQFLVKDGAGFHPQKPILAKFKVHANKINFSAFTEDSYDQWFCLQKKVANFLLENYPDEVLLAHVRSRASFTLVINPTKRGPWDASTFFLQEIETLLYLYLQGFDIPLREQVKSFIRPVVQVYQFPDPQTLFSFFRAYESLSRKNSDDVRKTNGLYIASPSVKTSYNPKPDDTFATYYLKMGIIVKCYEAVTVSPQPTGESRSTHDLEEIEPTPA